MNVLVFTSLYPNNVWPNHGVFVKERVTRFGHLDGCRVKVVAPVPYFPPVRINHRWLFSRVCKHEWIEGIEVYHPRYPLLPKVGMMSHGFTMFLSAVDAAKKIRAEFDFDLIDAHYVYPDGFAAVLLGKILRKPVVVSARGTDINLFTQLPTIRRLIRYTLSQSERVVAVCEALKNEMLKLGIPSKKVSVIPNGVDERKFYPFPRALALQKLGLPGKGRLLLSVGSLIPRKGFDLLIQALAILVNEFFLEDLHLVIIGEGRFREELMRMISEQNLENHVTLIGNVPHEELYLWYNAADLFCLTSSREGWPNVLMEALACGTPVVATDIWGVPELVCTDYLGVLTRRDARDIAEKVHLALRKKWRHESIVRFARQRTWEQTALAVRRIFLAAMDRYGTVSLMSSSNSCHDSSR